VKVGIKAVYTEKDLFILASWNDSTLSMVRGGSWESSPSLSQEVW
ncbi:hypothetical protein LCGC14_2135000, partial [marine sediment metagenome]